MKQKRYTISEASNILGYKPHVIRYYEKEFDLKIPRTKSNHRYFTENELHTFKQIKELQERGYNNTQIKVIMKSPEAYAQQIYEQLDGVAAAAHESTFLDSETLKSLLEPIIEDIKKEIIKDLKKQLEIVEQTIISSMSSLTKNLQDILQYIEDLKSN